jgi:hypothetical protein
MERCFYERVDDGPYQNKSRPPRILGARESLLDDGRVFRAPDKPRAPSKNVVEECCIVFLTIRLLFVAAKPRPPDAPRCSPGPAFEQPGPSPAGDPAWGKT